jgi:hypothetical protein
MIMQLLNIYNFVGTGLKWVRTFIHEDFDAETTTLKIEELGSIPLRWILVRLAVNKSTDGDQTSV